MNDPSNGENPLTRPAISDGSDASPLQLEEVVAEYMELRRKGDRTTPSDYAIRYPHLRDELLDLLPTVDAFEDFSNNLNVKGTLNGNELNRNSRLGDYRLVSEIARGGMGVIYEAEQESLGRRVAIKILMGPFVRRENDLKRFRREASVAACLHHTNIIPVFGVGEQDQAHYIVMQLIHGVGLDELFNRVRGIALGQWKVDEVPAATKRESMLRMISASLMTKDWETERESESETMADPGLRRASTGQDGLSDGGDSDGWVEPANLRWDGTSIRWPFYFRNIARIGIQAANALAYAHRHQVLHRDIKPGNLLVDVEGSTWIADFGLARSIDSDGITFSGDIVGTLGYMAPERFEGKILPSSDVFGLGIALYEMISLVRAFDGEDRISVMYRIAQQDLDPPHKRNPNVPEDLETIILKAVARDPADRYGDASELSADLQRFLDGDTIHAKRFSRLEMSIRWCRRNRLIASLASAVIVLLGTVMALTSVGYFRENLLRQRAEATSQLAVSALDQIYSSFSGTTPSLGLATQFAEEDEQSLLNSTTIPISREVSTVLENLLHFYDELAKNSGQSDELAVKSIYANRRVGDIHRQLGDLEKSLLSYQRAEVRMEQLPESMKNSLEVLLEKARILNGRGMILFQQNRFAEARSMHEEAGRLLSDQRSATPAILELASSLYLSERADQFVWRRPRDPAQPRSGRKQTELKEAIELLETLLQTNQSDPQPRLLLARCLLLARDVGSKADGENLANALKPQEKALVMLEELVQAYPEVAEFQYELAEAFVIVELNRLSEYRGRQAPKDSLLEAKAKLQRGLAMTATLESRNAQIPQFHAAKARLHFHLSAVFEELGQLSDAELELDRSIERQGDFVRFSGPEQAAQHELWLGHLELRSGQLLRDMSELDRSISRLNQSADRLERLLKNSAIRFNPFSRRFAERNLSRVYATLADAFQKQGKQSEADAILKRMEQSRA